ncbi:uncharacterized protein LOC111256665 [Setaria italica]|uniref:uncharacterized protein LOC111256665 n=1 Tax=Setaria italica TaxID=4555 RepID=UPI000BE622B5|nr:uncharacterized protein LOC111256665 [Setaria italica]
MEAANVNMLVRNVRGLNARCRRDVLRDAVAEAGASIVCVQETKLNVINSFLVAEMLGSGFSTSVSLPASGTRGGILIACKNPDAVCTLLHAGRYSITATVTVNGQDAPWSLTAVYGPQPEADKVEFLDELRSVQQLATALWVIAGDFNLLLRASDKNRNNINRRNLGRFRRFVDELQLKDVYLHGRRYTWSNEREDPTMAQLDRVLVSIDWDARFPFAFLQALSSYASDHCPLHLATNAMFTVKRRFHFEPWWPKLPGYQDMVTRAWSSRCASSDPFVCLDHKLKNTAKELQKWSSRSIGQIRTQLLVAKTLILWLDKAQGQRILTADERDLRKQLKCKSLGLASLERTMARQRTRLLFLREGDANTKLFHMHSSYSIKKKHIAKLEHDGAVGLNQEDKEQLLFNHFKAIMGTPSARTEHIDLLALDFQAFELGHLDAPFSEQEIWNTIRSMANERAPGPDGFTAKFYKASWPMIKGDVVAAFNAFLPKCVCSVQPAQQRPDNTSAQETRCCLTGRLQANKPHT